MSILVTGGTGYIGSHTVVELLAAGRDVVIVDNFSNSSPQVLERLKEITGQAIPFYEGSILDQAFLTKVFEENPPQSGRELLQRSPVFPEIPSRHS